MHLAQNNHKETCDPQNTLTRACYARHLTGRVSPCSSSPGMQTSGCFDINTMRKSSWIPACTWKFRARSTPITASQKKARINAENNTCIDRSRIAIGPQNQGARPFWSTTKEER